MGKDNKSKQGRQKIEIKRIESVEARQVCFSKRRPSLFKKASELSTLCGAEVAVVAFSPGGNVFSFGHPSAGSVANRFLAMPTLHGNTMGSGSSASQGETGTIDELNQQILELEKSLEAEKERKKRLVEATEKEIGGPVMKRLTAATSELGTDELEELAKELSVVQCSVKKKACEMLQDAIQTRRLPPQSPMDMLAFTQELFGGPRTGSMYTDNPSSSNGPREELDVNPLLPGSTGGPGNSLNGPFGG